MGLWFPSSSAATLYDSSAYEAFPVAATNSAGVTVAAWGTGTDHYTMLQARTARLPSGSSAWTAPTLLPLDGWSTGGVAGIAALGTRFALMEMATGPYRARVRISTDAGVSWGAASPVSWASSGTWTFPCGLTWVDDSTTDGLLLALSYGGGGVSIAQSADLGVTWADLHTFSALTFGKGFSEAGIVQAADGRLVLLVRSEPTGLAARLAQWHSADLGATWEARGTAIANAASVPYLTRLADGTLAVPYRDNARNQSHGYALSVDNGVTWITYALNTDRQMYGQFATRADGRAVLVAATQARTSTTDAWIWWQYFSVETSILVSGAVVADAPQIEVTVSAIPAGADTLTIERVIEGVATPVRGAKALEVAGGSALHLDAEAPVGRSVAYRVTAKSTTGVQLGSGESTAVALADPPADYAYLSDPLDETAWMLVALTSETDPDWGYPAEVTAAAASGAAAAQLSTGQRSTLPTWKIAVLADGPEQVAALRGFFLSMAALLVRLPSTIGLPGQLYAGVSDLSERNYKGEVAIWTVPLTMSGGPGLDAIQPAWTWADLEEWADATGATWGTLIDVFPTWLDLQRGL